MGNQFKKFTDQRSKELFGLSIEVLRKISFIMGNFHVDDSVLVE